MNVVRGLAARCAGASWARGDRRAGDGWAGTAGLPPIDILISPPRAKAVDFLLGQAAYAELLFVATLGPIRACARSALAFMPGRAPYGAMSDTRPSVCAEQKFGLPARFAAVS